MTADEKDRFRDTEVKSKRTLTLNKKIDPAAIDTDTGSRFVSVNNRSMVVKVVRMNSNQKGSSSTDGRRDNISVDMLRSEQDKRKEILQKVNSSEYIQDRASKLENVKKKASVFNSSSGSVSSSPSNSANSSNVSNTYTDTANKKPKLSEREQRVDFPNKKDSNNYYAASRHNNSVSKSKSDNLNSSNVQGQVNKSTFDRVNNAITDDVASVNNKNSKDKSNSYRYSNNNGFRSGSNNSRRPLNSRKSDGSFSYNKDSKDNNNNHSSVKSRFKDIQNAKRASIIKNVSSQSREPIKSFRDTVNEARGVSPFSKTRNVRELLVSEKDTKFPDRGPGVLLKDDKVSPNSSNPKKQYFERGSSNRYHDNKSNADNTEDVSSKSSKFKKSSGSKKFSKSVKTDSGPVSFDADTKFIPRGGWQAAADQSAIDSERMRVRELFSKRQSKKKKGPKDKKTVFLSRSFTVGDQISVEDLARRMCIKVRDLKDIARRQKVDIVESMIAGDDAVLLASNLGHAVSRMTKETANIFIQKRKDSANLSSRPPVVTVMGHVDHGKTSLLDALRSASVAKTEAGGITQKIGAYQAIASSGKSITFIDTPGHAAFSAMRSRGAKATDIVVLVVAADDGVMPQTKEAINHAKSAGVPIVVAINKIDKPGSDSQRVLGDLMGCDILVESLGGDVLFAEVSALKGTNLDNLEDVIILQADMSDLKSDSSLPASGVVIESGLDAKTGPYATMLVRDGSLKKGDAFIAGRAVGTVRTMVDCFGNALENAGPSCPVRVTGLSQAPEAGEQFIAVSSIKEAKKLSNDLIEKKSIDSHILRPASIEDIGNAEEDIELFVIIKTELQGVCEAVKSAVESINLSEVKLRIIHSGVGDINESDVLLASSSSDNALIIGFDVGIDSKAAKLAKEQDIDIKLRSILYDVIEDIKSAAISLLSPEFIDKQIGSASVLKVFDISKKNGAVLGCKVTSGILKRGSKVVLKRDKVESYSGKIRSLRRFKEDVSEVSSDVECGVILDKCFDVVEGDEIYAYEVIEKARSL